MATVFLRNAFKAVAAAVLAGALLTSAGASEPISVVVNQAKILKLARAADTIVIGNPAIADATVQDGHTIVLTGKGFGVTNLVILDSDGSAIVDEQIVVSRHAANSVRIYRRANVQTMSCSPFCEGAYRTEAERMSESAMEAQQ